MNIYTTKIYKHKDGYPVRFVKLWQYTYRMIKLYSYNLFSDWESIWIGEKDKLLKEITWFYEKDK